MLSHLLPRLLQALAVMLLVAFAAFAVSDLLGDPLQNMVRQDTPLEERAALRARLGLDAPLPVRLARFVGNAARGEFGQSYQHARPVSALIRERLPATLELGGAAALLAALTGIPAGIYAAWRRRTPAARTLVALSHAGAAMPTFLTGLVLMSVFAVHLGWLPAFGRGEVIDLGGWKTGFLTREGLRALILPTVTLGLFQATLVMRLVRAQMIEVLEADHIRFARARGFPERTILFRHALPNALAPLIGMSGVQIGSILAFSVVTESLFQWPGLGSLFIQAVGFADAPVITAYLVLVALIFVLLNLAADLLHLAVDPRLRSRNASGMPHAG